jgi:exopolysaccharide biosynthesis polyprenyl glycosylphosphotransferase
MESSTSNNQKTLRFERAQDILITLSGDLVVLVLAWYAFYYLRFELGWFEAVETVRPKVIFIPSLVLAAYWLLVFGIFGLYKKLYLISRFDEIVRVAKITIIGTLILFFLLFIESSNWNTDNIGYAKTYTLAYWLITFLFVSLNRFVVRSIQRYKVKTGRGLHKAVIVGVGPTALQVHQNILRHKTSGLNVVGFVSQNGLSTVAEQVIPDKDILGEIQQIKEIITREGVQDVIIAMEPENREKLIDVLDKIDIPDVSVKILPDFFQMISGLNQTNQIFGLPLIEVMPDPMPTWEKFFKRLMDVVLSLILLIVTLPVTIVVAILIRLTSDGSAVYRQKRVGKFSKQFTMYKFRTMYVNAETGTGPVWASGDDPRITPLGYWLRKLRIDELPQLINVIRGDMSLVGPRPERPFFVEQFLRQIPLYHRRLRVRPGITGWAQVKWKYDESFDDVVEKTKYDLFYVENMSLRMDLKILINTLFTMISGKGQ